jgi:hypothetical protein
MAKRSKRSSLHETIVGAVLKVPPGESQDADPTGFHVEVFECHLSYNVYLELSVMKIFTYWPAAATATIVSNGAVVPPISISDPSVGFQTVSCDVKPRYFQYTLLEDTAKTSR